MQNNYKHVQSAHCENGVTTGLLNHHGCDFMTEPLAFGLGSGLFYIHIPFIKLNGGPAISFRTMPGAIFKRTCGALKVEIAKKKFKDPKKASAYLDNKLSEGIPVACQVGVYHLSYFPEKYRFHFNAHNLIVFGKQGNEYNISDPVMEDTVLLPTEELEKVRFSQGIYAPHGHLYYPKSVNTNEELLRKGIVKGIKRNVRDMLHIPGNIAGVKGIVYTSKKIRAWRDKLGVRRANAYLGQIVRMQEEIGTGGGGFRYIYAAFLEQAAGHMNDDRLLSASEDFTKAGDLWRNCAVQMAGIYKGRLTEQNNYNEVADMFVEISETEKQAFTKLKKLKLKV